LEDGEPHGIFLPKTGGQRVRATTADEGYLYLLGDHRGKLGQDSRTIGLIDETSCRGTIVMRLTPSEGLGDELKHGYLDLIQ
jgi:hypothetical protein